MQNSSARCCSMPGVAFGGQANKRADKPTLMRCCYVETIATMFDTSARQRCRELRYWSTVKWHEEGTSDPDEKWWTTLRLSTAPPSLTTKRNDWSLVQSRTPCHYHRTLLPVIVNPRNLLWCSVDWRRQSVESIRVICRHKPYTRIMLYTTIKARVSYNGASNTHDHVWVYVKSSLQSNRNQLLLRA